MNVHALVNSNRLPLNESGARLIRPFLKACQEFFAEAAGLETSKPPRIFPWQEKVRKMKELKVEFAFFLKFNNQLRSMTPEDFLNKILLRLSIKKLIIGDDFRFGANREGDFTLLKEWGSENGIEISNTETYEIQGERVSSTPGLLLIQER